MQPSKRNKINQSEPEAEEQVRLATGYLSAEVKAEGLQIDYHLEEGIQREKSHITEVLPWPPLQFLITLRLDCVGNMAIAFFI